jgi:hypothetical protein
MHYLAKAGKDRIQIHTEELYNSQLTGHRRRARIAVRDSLDRQIQAGIANTSGTIVDASVLLVYYSSIINTTTTSSPAILFLLHLLRLL